MDRISLMSMGVHLQVGGRIRCCRGRACVLLNKMSSVPNRCRGWNQKCAPTTLPSLPATCVGSRKRLLRWASLLDVGRMKG